MERPALQRLLEDVRQGRVVVVYNVDRLTGLSPTSPSSLSSSTPAASRSCR
jgi:DNA invertase Pin-like site-specific DNA recombinase